MKIVIDSNVKPMLFFIVVVLLVLVSSLDYEEQVDMHVEYCHMVGQGIWPDYKQIYDEHCPVGEMAIDFEEALN